MAGEVVSCFLGPLSTLVAAHFWDATTQADIDNDVLYQGPPGRRTPRTLLVDFKEAVSVEYEWRLGEQLEGLDLNSMAPKWIPPVPMALDEEGEGPDEPVRYREYSDDPGQESQKKRRVDSGEQEANVDAEQTDSLEELQPKRASKAAPLGWQYIVPELHPDSLQLVSEGAARHSTGLGLYNMFPMGADAQTFAIDTFAEPIRRFVEGCDALQGYHMTCDALGAFGGLTHRLVETIKDDLGNRPVFLQAVNQPERSPSAHQTLHRTLHLLNFGFSTADLSAAGDVYVPLNIADWMIPTDPAPFPLLLFDLKADTVAQTAVIAAALDTYLLPTRSAGATAYPLGNLCRALRTYNSMRVSSMFCAVPFPVFPDNASLAAALRATPLYSPAFLPLSHALAAGGAPQAVGQAIVVRGLQQLPLNPPEPKDRFARRRGSLPHLRSEDEGLELFGAGSPALHSLVYAAPRPYPISAVFPAHILSSTLDAKGHIGEGSPSQPPSIPATDPPISPGAVLEMPIASHLATTPAIHGHLRSMAESFSTANHRLLPNYGRDVDDWREAKNTLYSLVDEYADGAMCSEDEDGVDD